MDPNRLEKLQRFAMTHAEHLKVEDVILKLYTQQVISTQEKQQLNKEGENKGTIPQSHLLLNYLQKKDNAAYEKFVNVLETTGQDELAHYLQHELSLDALLSSKDKRTIQEHFSELVNGMSMQELLSNLKRHQNYFIPAELDEIEAAPTAAKKADVFLSRVIMKGTYRHLALLKKTVLELGQDQLAELLPVNVDILGATAQPLEPGKLELQVQLIMSRPYDDLRAIVVTKIMDPAQDLRKKLILQYELSVIRAEAILNNDYEFTLTLVPRRSVVVQKIREDIGNGHLELLIKQYSRLKNDPPWQVKIKTKMKPQNGDGGAFGPRLTGNGADAATAMIGKPLTEDERAVIIRELDTFKDHLKPEEVIPSLVAENLITVKQTDYLSKSRPEHEKSKYIMDEAILNPNLYENVEKFRKILIDTNQDALAALLPTSDAVAEAHVFPEEPPPKPQSHSRKSEANLGPGQLPIVKGLIFNMVRGKDHTPYDIWTHLKKYKGKVYETANQLKNEDGLNLLHMCVDKGRLSLFLPLMHMGWWKFLSEQKVPDDSFSEHKGRIAKQIAEVKKTRKPLDEINQYTEWEGTLSSVMKACRQGDERKVRQQLEIEVEQIHYRDANNGNALYWAVVGGKLKILNMLLEAGIDPSMKTKKGETLLHIACMLGHCHMIKALKQCCGDAVNHVDKNHKTAFDRVAENGDTDCLIEMMKCNLYPESSFPVIAAHAGRKPCLEYCLEQLKMSVDSKDIYSRTPIHRAVEACKVDIVRYLLEKKARLDLLTCSLRNVLHIVAESGSNPEYTGVPNLNVHILRILLGELSKEELDKMINETDRYNGVDLCFLIRGRDRGRDAWHYVEVARWKVPVFLKKTKSGNVDVAAYGSVIKSGWGVNPDADVVDEIETMFKTRRLDNTAPRDMTPLHIAIFKGNTEIAKMLLEKAAKTSIKDKFGLTPLMMAAAKGFLEIIRDLERRGAKFKDVNTEGKTASEIADENENDDVVNYIRGRDYYQMSTNFLQGDIVRLKEELSPERLDAVRASGADVKRHIVNTLRDFRIDINQFLLDLGSGPVLEASEN